MKRSQKGYFQSLQSLAFALAIAAIGVIFGATTASAQTGKISVKITDAKSGEPLFHAIAQIVETKQGALSKENGVATIINVPPGENYTVIAKYAGYEPVTLKNVRVQSDVTTSLSVKLGSKSEEVVITAKAPLVEKSKTAVSTKFQQSTLQAMPGRQRIDEVIKLTPGVVQDNSNGGLSFHGSRGTSNSIRFNNIEVTDPLDGRAGALQNSVSRLAISEVNVVTAGGDASKGGYTGGEVNTQTRQGTSNFSLSAHYRTEIPSLFGYSNNGYQQQAAGDKIYEFSVGGPLFSDAVKYYITGKVNSFDFYNIYQDPTYDNEGLGVIDPTGMNLGQLPNSERMRRSATGKLTFNLLGFSTSLDALLSAETADRNSVGTRFMDPYYVPASNDINNVYSLTARGQIGDGILDLDGSYTTRNYQYGKPDRSQTAGMFKLYKFYSIDDKYSYNDQDHSVTPGADGIIDIYTPVSRQAPNPSNPTQPVTSLLGVNPFTGHIEGPASSAMTNNAYGLINQYYMIGNPAGFDIRQTGQEQINAQYTQQIGSHFINGGVEARLMSIYRYENQLPWDANPFKDSFQVHPYTAAIYATDKMEFSDITFQPGLRFDMYQSDAKSISNLYDPLSGGVTDVSMQTQLSPRLGITYAVTDQTTFNFNYNWYFKQPLLNDVLTNTAGGDLASVLARGNQILGNGGLKAERSKEIAVGFQTQLSDVFAFSVQGVYKDLRNQSGLQRITSQFLPVGYTIYSDDQYGNSRSVEIVLQKNMADNYSATFNYTYSVAKGTSSSSTENYSQLINADPNAERAVLPLQPFYLDYDKPHVAQLLLNVNYNKGEGPTIFGTKLLQLFNLATTTEYTSGTPYTRMDIRGRQIGEYNGDRNPDYFQTDATLTRTIPFEDIFGEAMKTAFLDIQIEVTNLFNRNEPIYVYQTTGQGDDDGTNGQYLGTQEFYNDPTNLHGGQLDPTGQLLYNPRIDLNKDNRVSLSEQQTAYTRLRSDRFARRTNYQIPRRVFLNLSFRF